MLNVAINGFGRIGRNFLKSSLNSKAFKVVAVNDLTDAPTLGHLFKYDSVFGTFDGTVKWDNRSITVNGNKILVFAEKDPSKLPWRKLAIDVVIESTGIFTKKEDAELHIKAGAKKVIISAPPKGDTPVKEIVLGVNEGTYDPKKDNILSNASCTTNCLAPIAKVLNDEFGIVKGFMTTIHAYTADQMLMDSPHKDLRRARAAGLNIVPTSTGAAKSVGVVIPQLAGKLTGSAIRVPVIDGSIVDLVVELRNKKGVDDINAAVRKAAEGKMKGIIEYVDEPIVSSDIIRNPHSAVFDSLLTNIEGDLIEVFAWYDNEWGYSCRLVNLVEMIAKTLKHTGKVSKIGIKNVKELKKADLKGKIVFLRGSADVPMDESKPLEDPGRITDTSRIDSFMPTLRHLIENGAKVVLQPGWLDRPNGVEPDKSVVPIYLYLKKLMIETGLLKHELLFAPSDLKGEKRSIAQNFDRVQAAISRLQEGQVLVLENPRFDPQYDKGDEFYAKRLAAMVNIYVADDFAQRHRPASDIVPMVKYLPRYAGIQLSDEIKYMEKVSDVLKREKRKPFVFIIAGKKIETKPGVVSKITVALNLMDKMKKTDKILVGGAVAYTFMIAERFLDKVKTEEIETVSQKEMKKVIGESYAPWEEIKVQVMQAGKVILKARERGTMLLLPMDHTIMKGRQIKKSVRSIPAGWQAVDIGKKTAAKFSNIIEGAGFVVMSGPVGMFDKKIPQAAEGSIAIAKAMGRATKKGVITISAGGESTLLINQTGVKVSHASIGGGSTLEFIEKGTLVGVEALKT